jgi:hypothetical protein
VLLLHNCLWYEQDLLVVCIELAKLGSYHANAKTTQDIFWTRLLDTNISGKSRSEVFLVSWLTKLMLMHVSLRVTHELLLLGT